MQKQSYKTTNNLVISACVVAIHRLREYVSNGNIVWNIYTVFFLSI